MNRRASCVGTFEVFEAAHVALRTLLAFSQPVNSIFWPIGMLNWLVAASKLHKHRETCCTAEWPFYSFLILCLKQNKTDFTIKWSIIKKSISYTGGSKRCNFCLEKKLNILKEKDNCLLNKRSEIISACQHKNRFQVKSLNKERNACYFNDNTPTFLP